MQYDGFWLLEYGFWLLEFLYTFFLKFVLPKDEGMNRERFIQAVRVSASIPIVMEATIIDEDVCYDGGVRDCFKYYNKDSSPKMITGSIVVQLYNYIIL
jgi:hypothetical protein